MRKTICFEWTDLEYSLNRVCVAIDKELSTDQILQLKNLIKEHIENNDVDIDDGYILEVCEAYFKDTGINMSFNIADYTINFDY